MKNRTTQLIAVVIAIIIIAAGAFFAYSWFTGGAEPSTDIDSASVGIEDAGDGTVFSIVAESSEATFELDEDLFGRRNTVVGSTNQIGGDIVVNFDNPQASQMGQIRINARTLATDSGMRDGMIRREILKSAEDEFEFIDFEPTAINGLHESVEIGGTYEFEIVGNLKVIGQINEVTFTASVTLDSETQISGTASTSILRSDFAIFVPDTRSVANVEDEVVLTLHFVATVAAAEG